MDIERLNELKGITEQLYQDGYIPLTYCDKTLELIDEAIARQSVASEEWVSVEDRLPTKEGQRILVYIKKDYDTGQKNFVRQAKVTLNKHNPIYCYNDLDAYTSENVTHWKPLPEPPKGYEPTTRKDRIVEEVTAQQDYQPWIPCSERMPTKEDADENGYVLVLFSDGAVESWSIEEIDDWNTDELRVVGDFGCITHWRPMLPIPKGE